MADFGVGSVTSGSKLPSIQVNNGKEDQPLKAAVEAPGQTKEEQEENDSEQRTKSTTNKTLGGSVDQFA